MASGLALFPVPSLPQNPSRATWFCGRAGSWTCDKSAVVHLRASDSRVHPDPEARCAQATSARGRSQVALAAFRRAAFRRFQACWGHRTACTLLMKRAVARRMSRYAVGCPRSRPCTWGCGDPKSRLTSRFVVAMSCSRVRPQLASAESTARMRSARASACAGQHIRTWVVLSISAFPSPSVRSRQFLEMQPRRAKGSCG